MPSSPTTPTEITNMKHTDTLIIGGGQAGLAMSRTLAERGVANIILERGRLGERWRSERWDSLRLLSPNWMARLPHFQYRGDDPDGFMSMPEYVRYLGAYAESFEAPVQTGTSVQRVARVAPDRFQVDTDRGQWSASNVVVATGFCDVPRVPAFAADLDAGVYQVTPPDYRNPGQVPAGNVLVVGASATGLQIAEELLADGRDVTVSVGTHVRLPRRYRGRDILAWLVPMGAFDAAADPADERQSPPPQLVGSPAPRDLDLAVLQGAGARLVGRTLGIDGGRVRFANDLREKVASADHQLEQVLAKVDGYIASSVTGPVPDAKPLHRIAVGDAPQEIDLVKAGITSVVWATGYARRYPWLDLPVLDERGEIRHSGGVTPEPGLYVLGMRFQRTKGSNLIDGVGADAEAIARHLTSRSQQRQAA
jgi:putative flavoprotein involved in K+ transport